MLNVGCVMKSQTRKSQYLVLIYVSDALQYKKMNVRACEDLEVLSIIVHNKHSKLAISLFY